MTRLVTYVPHVTPDPLMWVRTDVKEPRPTIKRAIVCAIFLALAIAALRYGTWISDNVIELRGHNHTKLVVGLIGIAGIVLFFGNHSFDTIKLCRGLKIVITPQTIYFNKRPPVDVLSVDAVQGSGSHVILVRKRAGLKPVKIIGVCNHQTVRRLLEDLVSSDKERKLNNPKQELA